jgi:TolA-binding protein
MIMKKHLMSTVVVLVVLVVVIATAGQPERSGQGRGRGGFMNREARLEAIKTIEAQLAKLKEEADIARPQGGFQDLSEEERTKLREQMAKVFQDRQKVIDTIVAQVAGLQGLRAPEEAEGAKFVIVNTADIKPIQESAVKEKATETAQLLERLVARASGQRRFGGAGGGQRGQSGERPQRQRQQQ